MPTDKKKYLQDKKSAVRGVKPSPAGYGKKATLLEEAITQMNAGKYGRSSSALKELLAMDPHNMEARRLFATLHLRLGSLIPARQAFDSLIDEAFGRQDYWLAESLLREYLAAGPRCVPYLEKLGSIYQDKGETLEAVAEYGKAIDILIEDPDPENPNHASQLFEKIKLLAPMSPVADRLVDYFDAQTGELIARPADAAATYSSWGEEACAAPMDSEPAAGIAPWEQADDSSPIKESIVPSSPSDISLDANALLEHEGDAIDGTSAISDLTLRENGADVFEPETIPTPLNDAAPVAPQQFQVTDEPSQEIRQEPVDQAVPTPMPSEDIQETSPRIPDETVTESSDGRSFVSTSYQATAVPSQETQETEETGTKGDFSWDSVFKSVWKFGSASPASVPAPETEESGTAPVDEPAVSRTSRVYVQEVEPGTIEIPEVDRASSESDATAVSARATRMPWDQVEESTIAIPLGQTEDTVDESPVEHTAPSATQVESAEWSYRETVAEQDHSPSALQPTDDAVGMDDFSINESSTATSTFETDSAPPGSSQILSKPESQAADTEEHPFTFAFTDEPSAPVEEAPTPSWESEDLSPAVDKAVQYEDVSSSSQETLESVSMPHTRILESLVEPEPASSVIPEEPLSWKTDEASAQTHRSSAENGQKASEPAPEIPEALSFSGEMVQSLTEREEWDKPEFVEAKAPLSESALKAEQEAPNRESTRFVEEPTPPTVTEAPPKSPVWGEQRASRSISTAAAAVDVLFEPSDRPTEVGTPERTTRPRQRQKLPGQVSHIGTAVLEFIGSCFSTTRAIVMSLVALAILLCLVAALGIGAVGLAWVTMEEAPSPAYQNFTGSPQQTLLDKNRNGYLLLLGFDAPPEQDPLQAGFERNSDGNDAERAVACLGGSGDGAEIGSANASAKVLSGWLRGTDPVWQFRSNQGAIRRWANQGEVTLGRYRRWQKLPFEDWGYGQTAAPPCASIHFAHHLYVAEGFTQQTDIGIDRLEADMEAWRAVLVQAKTLPVKMLAIQAVRDDAAVASGLLARSDFDSKYIGRLSHMLRPLSQAELAIRWPMQSELVRAEQTFDAQLQAEKLEGQPLHAAVASALPLPKQRRMNRYAAYYEASHKAAEEGQHGSLPKPGGFIKHPAATMMDYFTNPIENIIGLDPLPPWDLYNGLVVDADAHLRLAGLQVWIRRGSQDAELMPRIAKAGQSFYDPYTGLPMLVNQKARVLYSVGHDGKDQDGDPQNDVVVAIPANQGSASSGTPSDPSRAY